MTDALVLAVPPPPDPNPEAASLTPAQLSLRQMTLDSVPSAHSRRNYARALDSLFQFAASQPLSRELLMEWRAKMEGLAPSTIKPYLTVDDQIALLRSRGMGITDDAAAAACLGRIGYYRLSGYWYSARKSHLDIDPLSGAIVRHPASGRPQVVVEDDFRSGTTFQQVMDLYVFDKRLRLLFLDAIERIEVALRVDIALLIGLRDPWAHRDPSQLHGNFTKKINPLHGETDHKKWLERLDQTFERSKDEFVKHFKRKYVGEEPPIWIAIELWDFGMLSVFLSGMQVHDKETLAAKYGIQRHALLTSWVRNLNNVRNMCAHHGRLWNRSPADQVECPIFCADG
jgi:abortive infection bacteriophage resistance protein